MVSILPGIESVATGNSDTSKIIFWRLSLYILFDRYLPDRNTSLEENSVTEKHHLNKRILPFVTQYHPALPNLDITNEEMAPHTESTTTKLEIFTEPPLISHYKLENP